MHLIAPSPPKPVHNSNGIASYKFADLVKVDAGASNQIGTCTLAPCAGTAL